MKTQDLLLITGIGAVAYFIFVKPSSAYATIPRETFQVSGVMPSGETQSAFFNTTAGGVEAMNEITSKGGQLQRTSTTLKVLGTNDTIAKLGDGSIKRITASPAKTDSSGKTNIDKVIEKNKASKTPAQLARKKSVK